MSKTMRIFGNFELFGEWLEPDPSFDGHIIKEDDGSFIGYQDELYGPVAGMKLLNNDLNNVRFIMGYIANNNKDGAEGIAYIKLSQDDKQSPLLYVVANLTKEGEWTAPRKDSGYFERRGGARILLEEVAESDVITAKINNLHKLIQDGNNPINNSLLGQSLTCLDILQHIE